MKCYSLFMVVFETNKSKAHFEREHETVLAVELTVTHLCLHLKDSKVRNSIFRKQEHSYIVFFLYITVYVTLIFKLK